MVFLRLNLSQTLSPLVEFHCLRGQVVKATVSCVCVKGWEGGGKGGRDQEFNHCRVILVTIQAGCLAEMMALLGQCPDWLARSQCTVTGKELA